MGNSVYTLPQFLERRRQLPSLPWVALRVLELTSQPQVDFRALKECIENDPALTMRVLRAVNGSLFGMNRDVTDLSAALALLGVKPLKLLVLSFAMSEDMFQGNVGRMMSRFWKRALTRAMAARRISEAICRMPGNEPFVAALLQDVGMLALLQELGEPYARLLSRSPDQADLLLRETESLSFNHQDLTDALLADWGLPEPLRSAIAARDCETLTAVPVLNPLISILRLASQLTDLLLDERHDQLPQLLEAVAQSGPLTLTQWNDLVASLQERLSGLDEVLSLELPPGLDYRDVLVQAHGRMSEIAAELASELVKGNRPRSVPVCDAPEMLAEVQALSDAVTQFIQTPVAATARTRGATTTVFHAPSSPPAPMVAPTPEPAAAAANLEGEPGLLNRLSLILYACQQSRWPLSLVLVEIDRFPQLVLNQGPQQAARWARQVHEACHQLDIAQGSCVQLRQYRFAVALPQCNRQRAAKLCNHLLQEMRQLSLTDGGVSPTVSIGLASIDSPAKNFLPVTLVESATRCLSAAQLAGGNTLKSIGIF